MIRLSIIVPVYGVEMYIEECIRSLYNQDIPQEEYEVICVDDCSPDGSRAIIERLQKEYKTLRLLVHTENKRQGGARNTALREAKGLYVWFVDGDDYIQSNCLGRLLKNAIDNDLDVLRFYFSRTDGRIINTTKMVDSPVMSGSAAIFDVDAGEPIGARCGSACCQLIRTSFIREQHIAFAERVQYEDDDFAYQIYAYANRMQWISMAPYIVRETQNSTTRRRTDIRKVMDVYEQMLRMAEMEPDLSVRDKRWFAFVKNMIGWTINNFMKEMVAELSFWEKCELYKRVFTTQHKLNPYLSTKSYWQLRCFIIR